MDDRKKYLHNIDDLLNTYCKDCLLYRLLKNEKGRNFAHQFCIRTCTVGEQLKNAGKKLIETSKGS